MGVPGSVALAETYDALVTKRAYRSAVLSPDEACREVQLLGGKALDPGVCATLARVIGGRRTLDFVLDPQWREEATGER